MTLIKKHEIKHAQKESFIRKEISQYFMHLMLEQPILQGMYITRVTLSAKKGSCHVLFYSEDGIEAFKKKLSTLLLYKPSLRTALSKALSSRYVPELFFAYDETHAKQRHLDELIDSLKYDNPLTD